mgnify:FL=1
MNAFRRNLCNLEITHKLYLIHAYINNYTFDPSIGVTYATTQTTLFELACGKHGILGR